MLVYLSGARTTLCAEIMITIRIHVAFFVHFADGVYDLTGFQHPGGDDVNLFGGCDVTVAYRMIHAFHDSSGTRLKKSLKLVGAYILFICSYA